MGSPEESNPSDLEPSSLPAPAEKIAKFSVVGIGASAGGLDALEALTQRLSPAGMAYVVLQHLAPGHDSALREINMPQSALDAGVADFCLSPREIGDQLMRPSAHPFSARKRPARLFTEEALARIFEPLRREFGVDFAAYKRSAIERRLERRMALQKLDRVADYLKVIETNLGELSVLYSDLLIGVTCFFRDHEPFELLKTDVFPRLFDKRNPELPIRMWVTGCGSGEEAYSLAILVLEESHAETGAR